MGVVAVNNLVWMYTASRSQAWELNEPAISNRFSKSYAAMALTPIPMHLGV